MLLSASTALSRDLASYRRVRRFMLGLGGTFVTLHALVAFTPLFDLIVGGLLAVPEPVREPARLGMRIMTPWTISIAYRRCQQGVLIRFGRSSAVGIGTAVRLSAMALVLAIGWGLGGRSGIAVGSAGVAAGVIAEAVYAGIVVRPVLRGPLRAAPVVDPPLTARAFVRFSVPLLFTPLLAFLFMPLSSAALSRMPEALGSLAAAPVVNGLVFFLRSPSFALNEVVVALLDRPRALPALRRLTWGFAASATVLLLAIAASPLARVWLGRVAALPAGLVGLGHVALWLMLPMPALTGLLSLYQGTIVHSRSTRAVTESVGVFLAVAAASLAAGVALGTIPGLWVSSAAAVLATGAQAAWLAWRARPALGAIHLRDRAHPAA
jgi:hypothetical protein